MDNDVRVIGSVVSDFSSHDDHFLLIRSPNGQIFTFNKNSTVVEELVKTDADSMRLIKKSSKNFDEIFRSNISEDLLKQRWCSLEKMLQGLPEFKHVRSALRGHALRDPEKLIKFLDVRCEINLALASTIFAGSRTIDLGQVIFGQNDNKNPRHFRDTFWQQHRSNFLIGSAVQGLFSCLGKQNLSNHRHVMRMALGASFLINTSLELKLPIYY